MSAGKAVNTMVPDMKSTEDAVRYGLSIRGNQKALDELKEERARILKEARALDAKEDLTDAEIQRGFYLGFLSQMCREACEAAEGKLRIAGLVDK